MQTSVHNFTLNLSWGLIHLISQIDRFDASWASIEKREGQSLKQLKSIATVRSVGASTRIEGSQLSDTQVELLLKEIDITKLEDRDSQEVVGYFNALDFISENAADIEISQNNLKYLHQILLKHSRKDDWHRGSYKQQSNAVEARMPDGSRQIIFQTTDPGLPTLNAMRGLLDWYHSDNQTHPLVKCALFCYEFVTIHPFQDGNGRLSRLLATLLLLRHGYKWIEYVSLEHEIESRKSEYYRVLRSCQVNRPGENVTEWISFFFDALGNVQQQLMQKLQVQGEAASLSPRDKAIIMFVSNNPGCKSGEISVKLRLPAPTVKRALAELVHKNLLEKHGIGPGTNYTAV
ncbi:MAG: Fic family protein [Balneolaceae bacterium]|nr:MAG: Fic family protein [Balneolaceae bacterium]